MENDDKHFWTSTEIHSLINLVQDHPIIYDKKHDAYKSKNRKESAWRDIGKSVQKSAQECKRKWNTLRIQQRRILCKANKNKSCRYVQWHCYEPLKFLIPHMEWSTSLDHQQQKSEFSEYDEDDIQDEQNYNDTSVNITALDIKTLEHPPLNISDNEIDPFDQTPDQLETNSTASQSNHIQTTIIDLPNRTSSSNERLSSSTNDRSSSTLISTLNSTPNSTLNYFLMDIQQQMGRLNDIAQLELKIDIHKLLLEKLRRSENLKTD